jgi:hypothetical protein
VELDVVDQYIAEPGVTQGRFEPVETGETRRELSLSHADKEEQLFAIKEVLTTEKNSIPYRLYSFSEPAYTRR